MRSFLRKTPCTLRDCPRRPSPEDMTQFVSILRAQVSPQSDSMATRQTLYLLPPPHVWDTNHASCPLPVGLTLVSPTVCISGIDYAQKLNPESGDHDVEPYARLLGVRHIQTRRCVRITECSR